MPTFPSKTERVPVGSIHVDTENSRNHPPENIEAIRASLRKFGQQTPVVVDPDGKVLKGNGTLIAIREEGWEKIAIVRSKLAGLEALSYNIADNKTTDMSHFDFTKVAAQLSQLRDDDAGLLEFTGFTPAEIEPLLAGEPQKPEDVAEEVRDVPEVSSPEATSDHHTVHFTSEQWEIVSQAITKVREASGDTEIGGGRAIELFAADFLASTPVESVS